MANFRPSSAGPARTAKASFLDRLKDSPEEKNLVARFIARHLVHPGERIFIVSGTTSYAVAEQVMSSVADVTLYTNSVPVLWLAMQLQDAGTLAKGISVHAISGDVNLVTGIIGHAKLAATHFGKMIYSPHGITQRGIEGNRDVLFLKSIFHHCGEIVVPLTSEKIDRGATHAVKHLGHIAKEIKSRSRHYRIVVPPAQAFTKRRPAANAILTEYERAGVEIVRIPRDFAASGK